MFYDSGFHEWRASHNQFTPFFAAPTVDHGWKRTASSTMVCHWKPKKSLCNYRDYDLAALEMRRWASGKKAFGICHHNQSHKNENKQIYCPGFMMMFDEAEQILLTLCILFFSSVDCRVSGVWFSVWVLFCVFFTITLLAFFSGGILIKQP